MFAGRWSRRTGVALSISLGAFGLLPASTAAASTATVPGRGAPVVVTDRGAVRGTVAGGVEGFLGIPYAAAPVAGRRWSLPRPAAPWSGVRPATGYGNRCPALASTNGPRSETEDCLFVNVQRPARTRAGARVPVYVFIHGGGLTNGSSNQMNMDAIVRGTGVIGVTMNYRLGVFGFLGHPALTAQGRESGNYGFQDQQAALRWVQRNIARFGGDPRQVTIGGESAGGWSVCGHLAAPGSRGLFQRAMIQSGSCLTRSQSEAEAAGTRVATALGCTDPATAPACLRAVPAARLLDAGAGFSSAFAHGTPTLPIAPDEAVRSGRIPRLPVIIGANRDEGRTFTQGMIGWSREQYTAWLQATFGANAAAVAGQYPWPADGDRFTAAYLTGAIFTDAGLAAQIGGCPNRDLIRAFARHTRTYAYEFAHRTGPGLADLDGYVWGAGHAAELAYLWPSFDNGTPIAPLFDASERRLAREMTQHWGAFVRTGRPAADHQVRWPRYDRRGLTLSLRAGGRSTVISDATYVREHRCTFWDSLPAPAL